MPDPINYSTQVQSPFQAALAGYDAGAAIRANQLAQQKAQDDIAKKQALQADLTALSANPTPAAIAKISITHPELSEQFKRSFDMLSADQKQQKTEAFVPVYAAIVNGDNATAVARLRQTAEAQKNAGMDKDAEGTLTIAQSIEDHPESARTLGGLTLASLMGPEKFESTFSGLEKNKRENELQDPAVQKAKAEADKAKIAAQYADQTERLDLAKKSEDIRASKENTRLRSIEVALNKEGNGLKRQELQQKYDAAKQALDQKAAERLAEADSAYATADNLLNGAARILKTPQGVWESAAGPISSRIPTLSSDTADFEEALNTLSSQAYLNQIRSFKAAGGAGALSDKEGERLAAALQNLSLRQSPERLRKNVEEVVRLTSKARDNLAVKYGRNAPPKDTPNNGSAASSAVAVPSESGASVSNW